MTPGAPFLQGSASPLDFNLKHRVTGAAILIAVGVLLASIVLDEPEPPPADVARGPIDDAGEGGESFVSRVTPIGGRLERTAPEGSGQGAAAGDTRATTAPDSRGASDDAGEGSAAASAASTEGRDANVAATGEARQAAAGDGAEEDAEPVSGASVPGGAEAQTRVAAAAPADSGSSGRDASTGTEQPDVIERGWVVRIGTYAQPANVERLKARLQKVGFEARTSEIVTDGQPATRVWVGPYEKRVEAARIRARLEELIGQKGLITAYP